MSEHIVPILLLIVFVIVLVNTYVSLTSKLYPYSRREYTVSSYATMFTQGGCQQTIDDLTAFGIDKTQYTCVRISNVKP